MKEDNELYRKLDSFFEGLESGLTSLREVRSTYDERIAFDFNPLGALRIDENAVTRLLLYLLDPEGKHGQNNTLLKIFLEQIGAAEAVGKVEEGLRVKIDYQYYTDNRRPIDAVIKIGDDDYIIGIENKVWDAADQFGQVSDYIKDITGKSKGGNDENWLMLYLSSWGQDPSYKSIMKEELATYKKDGRFRNVPFVSKKAGNISLLTILEAMADAAKADSVRAFINLMVKYFESYFIGGITMDEQDYINKYVEKHPEIIKYGEALKQARQKLRDEFIEAIINHLKSKVQIEKVVPREKKYTYELYLEDQVKWSGNSVPLIVQLDRAEQGVVRIGVWSNNKDKFESLYKTFVLRFKEEYEYLSNDAWEGGYFEASRGFYTDDTVIQFSDDGTLPDLSVVDDRLEKYINDLKTVVADDH